MFSLSALRWVGGITLLALTSFAFASREQNTTSLNPSPSTPSPSPIPSIAVASPNTKSKDVLLLEAKLKQELAQKAKITIQSLDCPEQDAVTVSKGFNCRATAEGKNFTVAIAPKKGKGELQWSTKGLLVLPKLEQTIRQGIQAQFNVDVKTNCGGKIRVAQPGETFQCNITDGRGQTRAVKVRVNDDKGNITWNL